MTGTETFYKNLKIHREDQGIHISEISEKTKINSKYFKAIENGQFTILPMVYMRLFLRSYCIEIGADHDQPLKDFEEYTTGKVSEKTELKFQPVEETHKKSAKMNKDDKIMTENFSRQKIFYIIIGIILILSLVKFVSYLSHEAENSLQSELNDQSSTDNTMTGTNDVDLDLDEKQNSSSELPIPSQLEESIVYGHQKLLDQEAYRLQITPPFIFSITAKYRTKIHVSSVSDNLFNGIVEKDEKRTFTVVDTLKFDLWSARHVDADINGVDISPYITMNDIAIRASLVPDGSLSVQQFSH